MGIGKRGCHDQATGMVEPIGGVVASRLRSGDVELGCRDRGSGGGSSGMEIEKLGCRDWSTRMLEPMGERW